LDQLQRAAEQAGRQCVVGAVIFDPERRVFVPRRSPNAANLAGIWDLVGGHVEAGESLAEALRREVSEETGWRVVGDPPLIFVSEWALADEPDLPRREFDFVVSVDGDLTRPRLAPGEHTDYRWIAHDEIDLFDENLGLDDGVLRRAVAGAFLTAPDAALNSPHATIFIDSRSLSIEELRREWDPVMASQIAAHVTLAYPREVPDLDDVTERVRSAARTTASFELQLGSVAHNGDPNNGLFVEVHDPHGTWRQLRSSIAGATFDQAIPPHITLVHPRTSALGPTAWNAIGRLDLQRTVTVTSVAVTAFDGHRWVTVSQYDLP
jgi:8-oxo-dGTP pyrophosphatase MutT (NUDIX family)/2'-5' RNA ligase